MERANEDLVSKLRVTDLEVVSLGGRGEVCVCCVVCAGVSKTTTPEENKTKKKIQNIQKPKITKLQNLMYKRQTATHALVEEEARARSNKRGTRGPLVREWWFF